MLSVARLSAVVQPFQVFGGAASPDPASGFRILCENPWVPDHLALRACRSAEEGQGFLLCPPGVSGSGDRGMGDCSSWQGCQNSASSLTSPAPGPGVCSVRAFVPRRKLLGSLASPQGTLIQHLKEHILHGNMTSSDIILYYTTVSALSGWPLVHSGREAFIITLLFASPPSHVSIVRSTAQAAGCVPQPQTACMRPQAVCMEPRLCARDPRLCAWNPGCMHKWPLLWDPSLLISVSPSASAFSLQVAASLNWHQGPSLPWPVLLC